MASNKNRNTFRCCNVSRETTERDLKKKLSSQLALEEQGKIRVEKLSLAPSCTDGGKTQTAIVKFHPETPTFLKKPDHEPCVLKIRSNDVEIDQDFFGLTQLYPTAPGKITLEYVTHENLLMHLAINYGFTTVSWPSRASMAM